MSGRIILFGATGYTGRLTARALVERNARPLLAARNPVELQALARGLGDLAFAEADVRRPQSIADLITEGDVLVTTVGPFSRLGHAALHAAVEKGAHYIDATGEIAFSYQLLTEYHDRAKARGISIQTACGYDFVPGHCVAALALRQAAERARRVDIGYFTSGDGELWLSQGTIATLGQVMLSEGFFWRGGRLCRDYAGKRLEHFELAGQRRAAASISSTEHLFLPRHHPQLQEINVYLGWFGALSYLSPAVSRLLSLAARWPRAASQLKELVARLTPSQGRGPDDAAMSRLGSHIVATCYDDRGKQSGHAELVGLHGYLVTANILALMAIKTLNREIDSVGVVDPITALGVEGLAALCNAAGLDLC